MRRYKIQKFEPPKPNIEPPRRRATKGCLRQEKQEKQLTTEATEESK
jgi:hypothetical protein